MQDASYGYSYRRDFVAPEQARGKYRHTYWYFNKCISIWMHFFTIIQNQDGGEFNEEGEGEGSPGFVGIAYQ